MLEAQAQFISVSWLLKTLVWLELGLWPLVLGLLTELGGDLIVPAC